MHNGKPNKDVENGDEIGLADLPAIFQPTSTSKITQLQVLVPQTTEETTTDPSNPVCETLTPLGPPENTTIKSDSYEAKEKIIKNYNVKEQCDADVENVEKQQDVVDEKNQQRNVMNEDTSLVTLCGPLKKVFKDNTLIEKITFFISVVTCLLLAHALVSMQWLLPYYYTVATPFLLTVRAIQYWKWKYQFFLLDFCYFGNVLMLVYLWTFPSSLKFFGVVFSCANGPVLAGMIVFRNSLVFHDYDRLTSLFIHVLPAVLSFTVRWRPAETSLYWYTSFQNETFASIETSMVWLLVSPLSVYVFHKIAYVTLVYIAVEPGPEYLTSFSYIIGKQKGILYKAINLGGEKYRLLFYALWDCMLCAVLMGLTRLYFEFKAAHITVLVLGFGVILWNGATFYMDKFSHKGFKADTSEHFRNAH